MQRCAVAATVGMLVLSLPRPAPAQWAVTCEVGVARFGGTSRDTSGASVRPYRPTTWALRLDRRHSRRRLGIDVLYAKTGLAAERGAVAVVDYDAAWLVEIAPYLATAIGALGGSIEARVELAPVYDVWWLSGDFRMHWGARGAIALEWPLGPRYTGAVRAMGVLGPSVFAPEDVPDYVERRATRRIGVALSLSRRF